MTLHTIKERFSSPRARLALCILGVICISLLLFHAGFVAGAHNRFPLSREQSREWDFHAPGFGAVHIPHAFIMRGHGVIGTVQNISTSSLTIQTREGETQTVALTSTTQFRNLDGSASSTALSKGSGVMVLGAPDANGQISAEVIRIVPADLPLPQLPKK